MEQLSRQQIIRKTLSPRMLIAGLMGFSSGLPLLLTITLLQAWLRDSGASLTEIGLFGLVGLPYTIKFLWAPFMDRYVPPLLGRRRGWLLLSQLLLAGAIIALGQFNPQQQLMSIASFSLFVAIFSAMQDTVVDMVSRNRPNDDSGACSIGFSALMLALGAFILSITISL